MACAGEGRGFWKIRVGICVVLSEMFTLSMQSNLNILIISPGDIQIMNIKDRPLHSTLGRRLD